MKYVKLGKTDIDISVLALGCWAFAGGYFWGRQEEDDSVKTIHAALDLGINFLDTAEAYEKGTSEQIVGKALKGRRGKVVLATKIGGGANFRSDKIVEACENSLRNLQTDYVDLYYLHWPAMDVPFEEPLIGLEKLKAQGKIRAAGISNYGPKQMQMLEDTGRFDILEAHQLPYNLFWRAIEHGISQKTIERKLSIVCYSTLAQGLLSGKYDKIEDVPDYLKITRFYQDPEKKLHGEDGCEVEVFDAIAKIKAACAKEGYTMPQAALAWLYKQAGVSALLTGARNVAELMQNYQCLETEISGAFADRLSELAAQVNAKIGANTDMWMGGEKSRTF
ncbi:MAG: aldo/keto reductase [Clostridiales bacterium]|jgi:aryl-alcohol dehydrogenase-like predicted oxidoreductase|nr:aldo/keto reductase [Clostridiales bacterium]